MTFGRYLIGVVMLGVATGSVFWGARGLRRRFLPELGGPLGILNDTIVAVSTFVVVSQLLGTVGLFRLVPATAVLVALGLGGGWVGKRAAAAPSSHEAAPEERAERPVDRRRWVTLAVAAGVVLVAAEWVSRAIYALRHGTALVDTLWYHLPFAARFVQTGYTSHIHFIDSGSLIAFYPATSELVHGIGMMFLDSDVLSPLLNLGWLALAFLAAWCIGRPFGTSRVSLVGAAVVLATPMMAGYQGGSAFSDISGLSCLLAAIALLLGGALARGKSVQTSSLLLCAGLAAGLALGIKYTLVVPVAALTVGVLVVSARRGQFGRVVWWVVGLAATGSYWYLRNLFAVGNPVPQTRVSIGPLHMSSVGGSEGNDTVARHLFERYAWKVFVPGLYDSIGPVWWAVIAIAVAGFVAAVLFGPSDIVRMVAVVGGVSFVAYFFTPQLLGLFPGSLALFRSNTRYLAPALGIGAVLLPVALARFGRRTLDVTLVLLLAIVVASQVNATIWAVPGRGLDVTPIDNISRALAIGIAAVAIIVCGVRVFRPTTSAGAKNLGRSSRVVRVVLVIAVVIAGFGIERYHLDHRYVGSFPTPEVSARVSDIRNARIALVGEALQYPLTGGDQSNFVQYIGVRKNGESSLVPDCRTWRRLINRGHYNYVVATSRGFPLVLNGPDYEASWTRSDPAARVLVHQRVKGANVWLLGIAGNMSPESCAPARPRKLSK